MNPIILDFEKHVELGPVAAAKLLGYPYSTYSQYKNHTRKVRPYLRRHIQAIVLLPRETLDQLISEILSDGE
jgi:hypothetical protein